MTSAAQFTRQGQNFYFAGRKLEFFMVNGVVRDGDGVRCVPHHSEELGAAVTKLYDELQTRPALEPVLERVLDEKRDMPPEWRTDDQGNIRVFYVWSFREEDPRDKRFLMLCCFWWEGSVDCMSGPYTGEIGGWGEKDKTPRPYPQDVAV